MTTTTADIAAEPRERNVWRCSGEGEAGMVTAFTVILTTALLLLAGLTYDGGTALAAHVRAIDLAQSAARAGAQQLNLATYRATGTLTLDPAHAITAAQAFLTATGHSGQVSVTGDTVTVTVGLSQPTAILAIAGITSMHVTGTGTARAEHGLTQAQP